MFQRNRETTLISAGDDGRIIFSCPQLQKKLQKKNVIDNQQHLELMKINDVKIISADASPKNILLNANFNSRELANADCKSYVYSDNVASSDFISTAMYSLDVTITNNDDILIAYGGSLPMLRLTTVF